MPCWTLHLEGPEGDSRAAVSVGDQVYFFGGSYEYERDQMGVRVFNTVCLRWTVLPPVSTVTRGCPPPEVPSMRRGHRAVLVDGIVYLWGGRNYNTPAGVLDQLRAGHHLPSLYCNALYAFDVNTHRWFKPRVSGTVPEGRFNHSVCALGKVMYIHGGLVLSHHDRYFNDLSKLDTATMVWSLIDAKGTSPPAVSWHSANMIGTKMFVFGGEVFTGRYCKDMRVFDTETNSWLNTPKHSTEGRCDHSAFVYNGELYIFGGCDTKQILKDLWSFNPETFSWKRVQSTFRLSAQRPCSVMDTSLCCCMVGECVIFIGSSGLYVLDLNPLLKTLCKLAVIQYGLDQSGLPHNTRWELAAMTHTPKEKLAFQLRLRHWSIY